MTEELRICFPKLVVLSMFKELWHFDRGPLVCPPRVLPGALEQERVGFWAAAQGQGRKRGSHRPDWGLCVLAGGSCSWEPPRRAA